MTRRRRGFASLLGLVCAAAALAAGCGGGATVTTIIATVGGPQVVAANLAFSPTTVEVPSGEAFGLELVNRDSAAHNIAIYRDAAASGKLFGGEVFGGPSSRVYAVPPLPAGSWYFRCDVHPDMHGTIVASPAAGASGMP